MTTGPILNFDRRALSEARAAWRWYARRSQFAAAQFDAALDDAVRQIMSAPAQWPPYLHGTRVFRMRRFPYLVVYLDTPHVIRVVSVAHASRRAGYWRRRIP